MNNDDIEIIDDSTNIEVTNDKVDNNESTNLNVPENSMEKTQVLNTKIDKKALKKEQKRIRKEEKLKKRAKKNKKDNNSENNTSANVAENSPVTIVETAITKGSSGSQVIGNINGENLVPTNLPLPAQIDVSVKPVADTKSKTKKVKIVSKKDKIISIVISIFVVIVLGGAGYIAYYFGYLTNPNIYEVKDIYLELGDDLPSTVSYYITSSKNYDDMEFELDLSNVATNIIGTYPYSVKHKDVVKSAQIKVGDSISPELAFKDAEELVFQKDSIVTKDDIVSGCEDVSNCTYKTEYDINTETAGEKEITVIARDDVGNETRKTVTIKIIDIQKTIICKSQEISSQDKTFSSSNIYTLSFDSNDFLVQKSGVRQYKYSDYSAYFEKMNEYQNNPKYSFNRMDFTYSETTSVDVNNLTNMNDIISFFNESGYTCQ